MTSSAKEKSSLDSLMMAYTDLSVGGKGGKNSFKGPAMKDVKVEKTAAPVFQASAKARDWSSLAQNLEDEFKEQQQQRVQQQLMPFQMLQQPLPQHPVQQQQQQQDEWGDFHQAGKKEDDFADFISATTTTTTSHHHQPQLQSVPPKPQQPLFSQNLPQQQPQQSQIPNSSALTDTFGGFSSLPKMDPSSVTPTTSILPLQPNQPQSLTSDSSANKYSNFSGIFSMETKDVQDVVSSVKEEPQDDDDFGDFTASEAPPVPNNDVTSDNEPQIPREDSLRSHNFLGGNIVEEKGFNSAITDPPKVDVKDTSFSDDTVKPFTEPPRKISPVPTTDSFQCPMEQQQPPKLPMDEYSSSFKPPLVPPVSNELPSKAEQDFSINELPKPPNEPPKIPRIPMLNSASFKQQPKDLTKQDIFSPTSKESSDDFGYFSKEPPKIASTKETAEAKVDLFNDEPPPMNVIEAPSNDDFFGTETEPPPMMKMPDSCIDKKLPESPIKDTFLAEFSKPKSEPSFVPWLSDSPPPPPDMMEDLPDDEDEIAGFGGNNLTELSEDADLSGLSSTTIPAVDVGISPPTPVEQSTPELLRGVSQSSHNSSVDSTMKPPENQDTSPGDGDIIPLADQLDPFAPTTATTFDRKISSDSNASSTYSGKLSADLDFPLEAETEKPAKKANSSSSSDSPFYEWVKVLKEIRVILINALETFSPLDQSEMNEVLAQEKCVNYLKSLREIRRMFLRIADSHSRFPSSRVSYLDLHREVESKWKDFDENCVKIVEIKWEENLEVAKDGDDGIKMCGICLHKLKDTLNGDMNDGEVEQGSRWYHAPCANFWVNRIGGDLPEMKDSA